LNSPQANSTNSLQNSTEILADGHETASSSSSQQGDKPRTESIFDVLRIGVLRKRIIVMFFVW